MTTSKTIQLATNPEITAVEGMWAFSAKITFDVLADWCLMLGLLSENLIDTITVLGINSKVAFTLSAKTSGDKSIFVEQTGKILKIALDQKSLEFLKHYYWVYYMDGYADVNHIDLESEFEGEEMYLTFYADRSKSPLTPEQVRDRLGNK